MRRIGQQAISDEAKANKQQMRQTTETPSSTRIICHQHVATLFTVRFLMAQSSEKTHSVLQ